MSTLRVGIRADASVTVGSGHVMRCLALANGLRAAGGDTYFICRDLPGHLGVEIIKQGYPVHLLPTPSDENGGTGWHEDATRSQAIADEMPSLDWLVVDHYELDVRWEAAMRASAARIMVIDDLANRRHDCDVLLDQNYYEGMEARYDGLVPVGCRKLLGPGFALLRPEFRQERNRLRVRDGSIRRILVCFGGADPHNLTAKALEAISRVVPPEIPVDVVVGAANPHNEMLAAACRHQPCVKLHIQANNMAELTAAADLGIGAGGATTWERCLLGLPALTVVVADNQERTTHDLSKYGAIRYLGRAESVSVNDIADAIVWAKSFPAEMKAMSLRAMQLMDSFMQHDQPPAVLALLQETRAGRLVERYDTKIN
ncbi:MAG: UDP-2,4-diacetamido-2,4,6-trideoxy-beta-L-altropyranose hydrolase [Anaerolineae bacterium]|nr:UDP-2,4-diacetamido-2,4,6-trideoxy-beta-L-altropyranose hydrolase [Rhodocyclaceae bacterium]MCZ2116061.1 UDP-2,4-diacetamido-2,4,6-trideoxy-beta-L-altropyranose hydrolase [Anaerolineae bacterium]